MLEVVVIVVVVVVYKVTVHWPFKL